MEQTQQQTTSAALDKTLEKALDSYTYDQGRYPQRGGLQTRDIQGTIATLKGDAESLTAPQKLEVLEKILYDLGHRNEQSYFVEQRASYTNKEMLRDLQSIPGIAKVAADLTDMKMEQRSDYSPGYYLRELMGLPIDLGRVDFKSR